MSTKELIEEIISLPVDERARVLDSILKSLNPPDVNLDQKWADVAQKRLEQLQSGRVKAISAENVFERIWKRFSK